MRKKLFFFIQIIEGFLETKGTQSTGKEGIMSFHWIIQLNASSIRLKGSSLELDESFRLGLESARGWLNGNRLHGHVRYGRRPRHVLQFQAIKFN